VAEVVRTGMATELGRIAHLLATAEESATPLQERLAGVSRVLLFICLAIVAIVAAAGYLRGWGALAVLLSAVSLAVAAVPEGLPAIVTIALAIGVQRMASRHVLIRRLPAVETLGCATVICTDKTGTLTTGVMTVRELWGEDPHRLLFAAAASSDAELHDDGRSGVGDPTELAILAAAAERNILRDEIERLRPRVHVRPFDAARKRTSHTRADGVLYVKGAVEALLPLCARGGEGAADANARMAARGLRVLAVAVGRGRDEEDMELLGLIGMADPPRVEAIAAVAAARSAGIRTVMITGDHPVTANAIARELGILAPGAEPAEIVHARATPEDKLAIVRRWKARGDVVAMTGDGVNDAPALREAHIGIAMGRTGTEVTREAADMILTDDNFASIIAAVKEGRGVYDNIRKTLVYLLAGNTSELALMFAAAVFGLPLPLLPLQLLWINIVTDGLPALALVMDPTDDDVLKRPPRDSREPMLGRAQWQTILLIGALEGTAVLGVFAWGVQAGPLQDARSLAFSTLVFAELFRAFAARSATRIFWSVGAFTNLRLLGVVLASALVQVAIHEWSWSRSFFGIGGLSPAEWALAVAVGLAPVTVIEILKLSRRAA
jgi:Ca2+-transporting ATPase